MDARYTHQLDHQYPTTPARSATTSAAQNADIEDLFEVDDYLELFNTAMSKSLKEADLPPGDRIVRRIAEKIGSDFEHGDPADYFLRHRDQLLPTRPLLADLPRTRRLPEALEQPLTDLAPLARNDIWAVGAGTGPYPCEGRGDPLSLALAEHWNGHSWSVSPIVNPPTSSGDAFFGIAAATPHAVWAVGRY